MRFSPKKITKGFTLIEVMVALFTFLLIMSAASQIFTKAFAGYKDTKAVQRDTENAQYALSVMAKELRTSSIVNPSGSLVSSQSVRFYDYSQGVCFQYRINASELQVARASASGAGSCASASLGTYTAVTTGTVSGRFIVTPSTTSPKSVGKITLSLDISEGSSHTAHIQTTASLRDYGYVGL